MRPEATQVTLLGTLSCCFVVLIDVYGSNFAGDDSHKLQTTRSTYCSPYVLIVCVLHGSCYFVEFIFPDFPVPNKSFSLTNFWVRNTNTPTVYV